jgi:hypothetical protein
MPVLLLFADNDSVSQKHVAEFFTLLGGGVNRTVVKLLQRSP